MIPADCCCPIFQSEESPRRMRLMSCCPTHAPDAPPATAPRAPYARDAVRRG